jgi:hypothetical protein
MGQIRILEALNPEKPDSDDNSSLVKMSKHLIPTYGGFYVQIVATAFFGVDFDHLRAYNLHRAKSCTFVIKPKRSFITQDMIKEELRGWKPRFRHPGDKSTRIIYISYGRFCNISDNTVQINVQCD